MLLDHQVPLSRTFVTICVLFCADGTNAAEFSAAPEGTFSIAVIPDTQHYRNSVKNTEAAGDDTVTNTVFESYVHWIAGNATRQRIVFATHVGDIVDVNNHQQWSVARQMMDRLHGKVPYGISVGNHDMVRTGDSTLFQKYFPASRFREFGWYGGCFRSASGQSAISGNNANSFQLFSAETLDFIILHLECNAPDDVLAWADTILHRHADRRAMITTHMGLGPRDKPKVADDFYTAPKGRMTWKKCHGDRGNSPQQMWDKCFRKHSNLFLICCGDQSRTQAMHLSSTGNNGNTVHEVLSDYGSQGQRVMRFLPAQNRIEVRTWNPQTNEFCTETKIVRDAKQHRFDLEYVMTARRMP
ncbi:MAG: serine/threonine protein phosphatase [Fuerstiella sp.]|nr:serine/threonine protein phosphatase [Fuerstiella sp.]MCP4787197.1 serine/threonine protein phosphatase [Fuerstiella sp.]MCP4855207.1 serine/threonine protein phosphatase [Fuerstiella sp.]